MMSYRLSAISTENIYFVTEQECPWFCQFIKRIRSCSSKGCFYRTTTNYIFNDDIFNVDCRRMWLALWLYTPLETRSRGEFETSEHHITYTICLVGLYGILIICKKLVITSKIFHEILSYNILNPW